MDEFVEVFTKIPQIHNLLGCDFGTKVSVPGVDDKKCMQKATVRIVLYDNGQPLPEMKFCEGHFEFVKTQSDPR